MARRHKLFERAIIEHRLLKCLVLVEAPTHTAHSCIARVVGASRVTVINDVDALREDLARNYLKLESRPGKGLLVLGEEAEKRSLLLRAALSPDLVPSGLACVMDNPRLESDTDIIARTLTE